MIVIGIVGRRGAGKDTIALYMKKKFKFESLDFTTNIFAPLLKKQGKAVTRENLIELAMNGRKKYHNGIWAEKLCNIIKNSKKKRFVISGIRFKEEVEIFKKNFNNNFKLIFVRCDARKRYKRLKQRGTKGEKFMTYKEFLKIENSQTEKVINKTMKLADFFIDNNRTKEELYRKIEDTIKAIGLKF